MSEFPRIPPIRPRDAVRPLQPVSKPRSKRRESGDEEPAEGKDRDADPADEDGESTEIDESGRVDLRV